MDKIVTAKCAYLTGNGNSKGGFHFSMVAEYHTTENPPKAKYRKLNVIFYPTVVFLKAENLGIDFSKLQKNRKDSYVFNECPYSPEQLKNFILPSLRRIVVNFEELEHPINRKTGQPRLDSRFLTDKDSGQFFATETRFIEKQDFVNFSEAFKENAIKIVENCKSLV